MKDNIITLNTLTTLDIPVDNVLEGAKGEMETVIVVGYKADGSLYVGSSTSDLAELYLLSGILKAYLMKQIIELEADL